MGGRRHVTREQGFDPVPETQVEMLRHFHPHRVEAVALAFLCLPYPNIRALAVEILQSVRSIAGALSEVASQDDDDGEVMCVCRVVCVVCVVCRVFARLTGGLRRRSCRRRG
jgi:hypothetical protein